MVKVFSTLITPYETQTSIGVINNEDTSENIVKNGFTELKYPDFDYHAELSKIKPGLDIIVEASVQLMKKGDIEEAFYLLKSHPECENIAHTLSQDALSEVMGLLKQCITKEYTDFRNFWKSISPAARVSMWKGNKAVESNRALSVHLAKNQKMRRWSEVKALIPPLILNVFLLRVYEKVDSTDPAIKAISKIFIKNELFQKLSYQKQLNYSNQLLHLLMILQCLIILRLLVIH
mgnify:CR=1 FL=1